MKITPEIFETAIENYGKLEPRIFNWKSSHILLSQVSFKDISEALLSGVYIIEFDSKTAYIGKTKRPLALRIYEHINEALHRPSGSFVSDWIQGATEKDVYIHEYLKSGGLVFVSILDADDSKEREYIENSKKNLLNKQYVL